MPPRQGKGVVRTKRKVMAEIEADLEAALEAVVARHGATVQGLLIIVANIPGDDGRMDGRAPFLYHTSGHPSLTAAAAAWVAEDIEAEFTPPDEDAGDPAELED